MDESELVANHHFSAQPQQRARRKVLLMAAGAGVLSVGGLVGASFIKSPEQQRAETEAPPRSQLTSKVERRVLVSTVVTRGSVTAASQIEVTPAAAQGASALVVTGVFKQAGAAVTGGDVVLSVSGRPLMVLEGQIPAYRDMRPGDVGPDIEQLQQALSTLRLYSGADAAGRFGSGTKEAVRRLFAKVGFAAADTGGPGGKADRAALRAADDTVTQAQQTLNSLAARMSAEPSPSAGPGEPTLRQQWEAAQRALQRAKEDRAELIASTGPMLPLAEVVFLPQVPGVIAAMAAKVGRPVQAPLVTFASGALELVARLPPEQASLLKAGMPVEILAEGVGKQTTGLVTSIGNPVLGDGTNGPATPQQAVTVTPREPMANEWNGADVRLTISAAMTPTEVLVVPLSAVSSTADGKTIVTVVQGDLTKPVQVRVGASGDGYVEVAAVSEGLEPGDEVVVGR